MLPMSNPSVNPGSVETQQMRVVAPIGVSFIPMQVNEGYLTDWQSTVRLRLRIAFAISGQNYQDQVDFSGFPVGLTGGS
jgi:AP-1 complex subunit gamma-1